MALIWLCTLTRCYWRPERTSISRLMPRACSPRGDRVGAVASRESQLFGHATTAMRSGLISSCLKHIALRGRSDCWAMKVARISEPAEALSRSWRSMRARFLATTNDPAPQLCRRRRILVLDQEDVEEQIQHAEELRGGDLQHHDGG